jgi:hypothetical protein
MIFARFPFSARWLRCVSVAGILLIALGPCHAGQTAPGQSAEECSPVIFAPTSFFVANGRVELATSAPLKAGEPNELTLVLHGPPIGCLIIEETAFGGPVAETSHRASIHRRSDGSQYVLFAPVHMGKVGVRLRVQFPDGGFSRLDGEVNVEPSDREPAALIMRIGGVPEDTNLLRLGLDNPKWRSENNWEYLYPAAYYLDSKQPVYISKEYLHLAVKQPDGQPVVELREDGGIRPLRLGDALLVATFGKTTREICIQVRAAAWRGDNSRCGELRSPPPVAPMDTVWTHNPDGFESKIPSYAYFVSRISITAPSQPVGLAQPLGIPIAVSSNKIRSVTFTERWAGSNASILRSSRWMVSGPQKPGFMVEQARLVRDDGNSKVFEITPVALGEETVSVAVDFDDGGFEERYFHLRSVLSDSGLEEIRLDYRRRPNGQQRLTACLKYTQLANCIGLSTLDGLNIRVMQPNANVLRIDSSGLVHELSPGTATVIVSLGRVQQSLTLKVSEPLVP